jgi:hypothetical protein
MKFVQLDCTNFQTEGGKSKFRFSPLSNVTPHPLRLFLLCTSFYKYISFLAAKLMVRRLCSFFCPPITIFFLAILVEEWVPELRQGGKETIYGPEQK